MSPDPRCTAVSAAMSRKGLSYGQLASKIGTSEQHIISICTGSERPTDAEFKALAAALDMKDPPQTGSHATS